MHSNRTTAEKCAIFGFIVGVGIAIAICFGNVEHNVVETVRDLLGWPVNVIQSTLTVLGLKNWFQAGHDWLLGPALSLTAGAVGGAKIAIGLAIPISGRPIVDFALPAAPSILDPNVVDIKADKLSALGQATKFIDRDDEVRALLRFAGEPLGAPTFMVLSGREGVGKSRLGIEALRRLNALGWDVGILRADTTVPDISRCHFRRKSILLIDNASVHKDVWMLIDALLQKKRRPRIIIADQSEPSRPSRLGQDATKRIDVAEREALRLEGLTPSALVQIARDVSPSVRENADGRPLYVLLGDDPAGEIVRRADQRLELANSDDERRLLELAALAGPFSVKDLRRRSGFNGVERINRLERLFEGENREFLKRTIPPIRPQPIADALLLSYAAECTQFALSDLIVISPRRVVRMQC